MRTVVVVWFLVVAAPAFAQAPGEVEPLAPMSAPAHPVEKKDPGTAVAYSIGVTTAGYVMTYLAAQGKSGPGVLVGLAGMYLGPSTGQWYAGQFGGLGLASRALAVVLVAKGISTADNASCDPYYTPGGCAQAQQERRNADAMIYGGLILWAGSTIFDFYAAHQAAKQFNREHAITVAPTLMSATGSRITGLTLSARF